MLFYGFLVMCLSAFGIRVKLLSQNDLVSVPSFSDFLKEFVNNWYSFFIECLVEFSGEAIWFCVLICGLFFFFMDSISSLVILFQFSISSSFSNFIVQVQFSAFSLHPSPTPAFPTSLPFPPPPPIIVHVSFIIVPTNPSPFSPEIPSPLPSGHCWPFLSFSVFGYILLVCFVGQVPVKGEILRYVSFTAWLILLSIMLSSSIHAVAKGRSFFFLSAMQDSIV